MSQKNQNKEGKDNIQNHEEDKCDGAKHEEMSLKFNGPLTTSPFF